MYLASPAPSPAIVNNAPPPNFREISTLASWTVSSSKPGCSIPQLRHPSTSLFWQSDGPQPHYLNIHFFKLVRIVGLRLYLDFEADESYTPTRIVLLAGSGMNDLVEWGEMKLENPRGWIWADFEGVRDPETDSESGSAMDSDGSEDDDDDEAADDNTGHPAAIGQGQNIPAALPQHPHRDEEENDDTQNEDFENALPVATTPLNTTIATPTTSQLQPSAFTPITQPPQQQSMAVTSSLPRPHPRVPFTPLDPSTSNQVARRRRRRSKPPKLPLLRCHLIQVKILENHQNGKDTHLRGLQVFALDEYGKQTSGVRVADGGGGGGGGQDAGAGAGVERDARRRLITGADADADGLDLRSRVGANGRSTARRGLDSAMLAGSEWMGEPVLR